MMNEKNEMTKAQAQALAVFIHSIRSDWDPRGIVSALGLARGRGGVDALAVAAVRAAMVPSNRTPAVIGQSGPHWVGAFVERQGPERERECPEHGCVESKCRKHHQRSGVPGWWSDFRKGRVAPPSEGENVGS